MNVKPGVLTRGTRGALQAPVTFTRTSIPVLSPADPDFELAEVLGSGGIAKVRRVIDRKTGDDFAVKTLDERFVGELEIEECFLREARLLASAQHPGIVSVYNYGRGFDGTPYYTMELLKGPNLSDAILFSNLQVADFLGYCLQAANALAYLHRQGVVHRDVKAENLVIDATGRATLIDLGIADVPSACSQHLIAGTPRCMAPEQITGDAFDHHLDIWAFGVLLYEGVTGRSPFFKGHEALTQTFDRIRNCTPRPLSSTVPRQLRALISLCLQVNPALRPDSMEAVEATLQQIVADGEDNQRGAGSAVRTRPRSHYRTPFGPCRNHQLAQAVIGAGPWTDSWHSSPPTAPAPLAGPRPVQHATHTVCVSRGVGLRLLRESSSVAA